MNLPPSEGGGFSKYMYLNKYRLNLWRGYIFIYIAVDCYLYRYMVLGGSRMVRSGG